MDLRSYQRWFDYSRARDEMFATTDTAWAPWWVVDSNDKRRARLNVIAHLLDQVPYSPWNTGTSSFPTSRSLVTTKSRVPHCITFRAGIDHALGTRSDRSP